MGLKNSERTIDFQFGEHSGSGGNDRSRPASTEQPAKSGSLEKSEPQGSGDTNERVAVEIEKHVQQLVNHQLMTLIKTKKKGSDA